MTIPFITLAVLAAPVIAFVALALAMDRHWEQLRGRGAVMSVHAKHFLQVGAAGMLILSFLACLPGRDIGHALVVWAGALTASNLLVMLTLAYAAVRVLFLAGVAFLLMLIPLLATVSSGWPSLLVR